MYCFKIRESVQHHVWSGLWKINRSGAAGSAPVEMKFAVRTAAKSSITQSCFQAVRRKVSAQGYRRCGLCRNRFSVIRLESGFKIPDRRSAVFKLKLNLRIFLMSMMRKRLLNRYPAFRFKSTEQAKGACTAPSVSGKRVRQSRRSGSALLAKQYYLHQKFFPARLRSE